MKDVTELAVARAGVSHNHKRGRAMRITFTPIGAGCSGTDGIQPQGIENFNDPLIFFTFGNWPLEPFRQSAFNLSNLCIFFHENILADRHVIVKSNVNVL